MKSQKKFWTWKNQADESGAEARVLELYGTIAEESWLCMRSRLPTAGTQSSS